MSVLERFHKGLLDIRSHQWKYRLEPYRGCSIGCVYCAAKRHTDSPDTGCARPGLLRGLQQDLSGGLSSGITYISPAVDPYQPLERREKITRNALKMFLEHKSPVVLLTKSPLILRDMDLLSDMRRQELIQVQFTLMCTDAHATRSLEPAAASPRKRLLAAEHLAEAGIDVHFHVSPYIQTLYKHKQLEETVRAIAEHGGKCIFTNPLGLTAPSHASVCRILADLAKDRGEGLRRLYPRRRWAETDILDPRYELLAEDMLRFAELCATYRLSFVCEFIPEYTRIQESDFTRGVFQQALPAVYQMMAYWKDTREPVEWDEFKRAYLSGFPAVDEVFLLFVKHLWDTGSLFENTTITPLVRRQQVVYQGNGPLRILQPSRASRAQLWRRWLGRRVPFRS